MMKCAHASADCKDSLISFTPGGGIRRRIATAWTGGHASRIRYPIVDTSSNEDPDRRNRDRCTVDCQTQQRKGAIRRVSLQMQY